MRLINEDIEPQTKKIASLTGTRPDAVKQFVSAHALNITKLLKFIEKGKLSDRMDFVTALAGKPGNPIQKKMIKMFSESVNEAKELKWQDAEIGDAANVKSINKTGLIIKTYGRKFHLKFANGSTKTYDANELTFIKNESVNESPDVSSLKKIHDAVLKFLKTKKGVGEVKEFSEFPNRYGDNVSTFSVKYNIEDKYNYDLQEIKIEYSTSRVFIPNKGYFPFKTFNDIKNIINKKSSLKESVNESQVVNKKTGKDITRHVLDLLSGKINQKQFEKLTGLKKESVNEEEIKWNAVQNAIINFLKANTKILDKRVQAKDTEGVKGGLKSIISGLTNAQKSLKLESVNEAKFGYKDSTASYINKHNNEYKIAEKLNKGSEMKFYDDLQKMEDKIGHPKFMIFVSNALRGYGVDMYKDPKIKNPQDAQEALFLLSK